jgi:hypothetical protein
MPTDVAAQELTQTTRQAPTVLLLMLLLLLLRERMISAAVASLTGRGLPTDLIKVDAS